jgi:hypothetical protein
MEDCMTFEELQDEWDQDSTLNSTNIGEESIRTPKLHAKYLRIHSKEKMKLLSLQHRYKILRGEKKEFFINPTKEVMQEKNWKIPERGKILKSDIESFLDIDPEILDLELKIGVQQEKVEYLKSILQSINGRSFIIKNFIEERKWLQGS